MKAMYKQSNPALGSVRLKAVGDPRKSFDIFVCCDDRNYIFLMPHRKDPHLFALLQGGISLSRLHDAARRTVTEIAQKGNRGRHCSKRAVHKKHRTHSQRIEYTVQHIVSVTCEFVMDELKAA